MYSLQVSAVATHIDEYEMIFFQNYFSILIIHYDSVQNQKSIYTSSLPLFILFQFIFTKYIHTYLISLSRPLAYPLCYILLRYSVSAFQLHVSFGGS